MKKLLLFLVCLSLTGCSPQRAPETFSETQFLMDTVCTVQADSKAAVSAAFARIRAVQEATDFYNPASTVSAFNRAKAGEAVPLDTDTEAIVKMALSVSAASGGAFDITIAPVQRLWPFHKENPVPPTDDAIRRALPLVGYQHLLLNTDAHTLTKTKNGVEIDLGGAAKGYAADVAAEAMQAAGASYGILNLGGNVLVFGQNPQRKDGAFAIGLQTPFGKAGEYQETVSVKGRGAVVTSGVYQRQFTYEGKRYHHILNPQNGYPANAAAEGVSILADSALLADCLSTACLLLNEEDGRALAENMRATVYYTHAEK